MRVRAFDAESPANWSYVCCARAASCDSQPAAPQVTGPSVPFGMITARTGSDSSRHQVTSVMSPNVQIIAMPLPFAGSASAWARTGTETPNSGVLTWLPKSGL